MKIEDKILICGASIAGTAVAFWLEKYGYKLVIVEKAREFRNGGQNVDIKGPGQDIIKMMGIEQEVNSKNTGELGLRYLNKHGAIIASYPKGAVGGLTTDFEILRGDLARIIYQKTEGLCEYRFGTYVTGVVDDDQGVTVTFNNGVVESFAMVICADGIGSTTRDLVMPECIKFNYLGAYMSFFSIPKVKEDDLWAKAYQVTGGGMIFLRPGHEDTTTVLVSFLKEKFEPDWSDVAKQKDQLRAVLDGKGGIAQRVADQLEQVKDFYFGPMSQVKASRWSKRHVVLLGDAAHAPTPFTGMGTYLALTGAYLLAGEIKRGSDLGSIFNAYEKNFRPHVERSQKFISARAVKLLHQRSKFGILIARTLSKILAHSLVQRFLTFIRKPDESRPDDELTLPAY